MNPENAFIIWGGNGGEPIFVNVTGHLLISLERKEFFVEFLPPVSAQLPRPTSLVPSLLELNMAELSAAQDWENEWKSQGLGSRMAPEVGTMDGTVSG